jgi:predicted nucleic acid-binding protein
LRASEGILHSAVPRAPAAVADLFDGYAAIVRLVAPASIAPVIVRDPTDDRVLATALAGQADLIVSGDLDLLDLRHFMGIDVVTAASAIERLGL